MSQPLQGRRLLLRPVSEGDADSLFRLVDASREGLKRRLRWVAGVASVEDCRGFVRASSAAAPSGDREVFSIIDTRSGALVGVAALQGLLAAPGLAELSLWIGGEHQGRGCASEAGRILVAHAFRRGALRKLYARIDPVNRPARKVLQKIGFFYEGCLRREKRLNGRWIDQECWGLLKAEWRR